MSNPTMTPAGPWTVQAILDSTRSIPSTELTVFKTVINASMGTIPVDGSLTVVEAIHPVAGNDTLNIMLKGTGPTSVAALENAIYAGARTRSDALMPHANDGNFAMALATPFTAPLALLPLARAYLSRAVPAVRPSVTGHVVFSVESGHAASVPVVGSSSVGAVFAASGSRSSDVVGRSGNVGAVATVDVAGQVGGAVGSALSLSPVTVAAIVIGGSIVASLLGLYIWKQVRL